MVCLRRFVMGIIIDAPEARLYPVDAARLREIVVAAELHRGNRVSYGAVARKDDAGQLRLALLQRLQGLEAVHAGHHHVYDGGVEWRHRCKGERLVPVCRGLYIVPARAQGPAEGLAEYAVIVKDEYARHRPPFPAQAAEAQPSSAPACSLSLSRP